MFQSAPNENGACTIIVLRYLPLTRVRSSMNLIVVVVRLVD